MKKFFLSFSFILFAALSATAAMPAPPRPIAYDIDPPVICDGKLDDWQKVAVFADLSGKKHLAYDRMKIYKDDRSLNGVIKMLWRRDGLLVAATVTDNKHVQTSDSKPWMGDHVDLRLDMTPDADKERENFGDGQFQVVLSPGNFQDIKPSLTLVKPQLQKISAGKIYAARTEDGYLLEAFIPWAALNVKPVTFDQVLALDVLVSDSDDPRYSQQSYKVVGPLPFTNYRNRLVKAVFADGNGESALTKPMKMLAEKEKIVNLAAAHKVEFELTADEVQKNDYLLTFLARAVAAKPAGFGSNMLNVEVNGRMLLAENLFGVPLMFSMRSGRALSMIGASGALTLPWSADYKGVDGHKSYGVDGRKSCEYAFSLAGLLKVGKNVIVFKVLPTPVQKKYKFNMAVCKVALTAAPRGTLEDTTRPPQGKLERFEPEKPVKKQLYNQLKTNADKISFAIDKSVVTVKSQFLTANSKWGSLNGTAIKHKREVISKIDRIIVRDTFRNTSAAPAAVLQRHTLDVSGLKKVFINGSDVSLRFNSEWQLSPNCTVIAMNGKTSVGLLPNSDAFSVHGVGEIKSGKPALADYQLAIGGNAEYTAEFMIIPWDKADYWSFINQARRILDVNYTVKLLSGFWNHYEATRLGDKRQRNMVDNFGITAIAQSNNCVHDAEGYQTRGEDLINGDLSEYRAMRKFIDRNYPGRRVKHLIYFHCFLDTTKSALTKYANDRIMLADGTHPVYGNSATGRRLHGILPTEGGWGKVGERWLELIVKDLKADGVFWDEFVRSNVPYDYNPRRWDNFSADVNRFTGKIIRLKSSVTLLSLQWRLKMVRWLRKNGKELIINGAPMTPTLRKEKIQTMFETGQISNVLRGHLATPVALGDHLTERKFTDSWKVMLRALDFGGLYCIYQTVRVYPSYPAMTKWMYPFTPVELHKAYLIGKERIITKKSGLFGWGDKSEFDVFVFDTMGKLTDKYPAEKVVIDNKNYAEIRIPGNCAAVVVRK